MFTTVAKCMLYTVRIVRMFMSEPYLIEKKAKDLQRDIVDIGINRI